MPDKRLCIQGGENNIMSRDNQVISQRPPLRLWEIDHFFKCPVVGMCLTLSEQKQLIKKTGFSVKNKSPFELHEILVAGLESESRLTRKVENLLNRKFGKEAASLLGLGHEAFMGYFKAAFEAGDCAGVSWAAAINPNLPIELKGEIFGDIHMAMHWSGDQSNKLKQRLAKQQKEIEGLRRGTKEVTRFRRSLQKENERLNQDQADLRVTLAAVEKEKTKLQDVLDGLDGRYRVDGLEQENRMLKEGLDALSERLAENQCRTDLLKEKNLRLSAELERQRELNRYCKKETQKFIGEVVDLNRCEAGCPSFDLCKKRILIVGGITRMEVLYRELIESSGGIFEYHDGYMKKGVKGLECRLRRADVVLCPVSCNSHAACSLVKNLGKKHNTPVHLMANFSLNAITHMIGGNGGEKSSQNESPAIR